MDWRNGWSKIPEHGSMVRVAMVRIYDIDEAINR